MYKHQLLADGIPWFGPTAPYYRFLKEVLQSTALEMPVGTLYPSIVKAIASKWKELPREERKLYVNACATEKQKRAEELVGGEQSGRRVLCSHVHLGVRLDCNMCQDHLDDTAGTLVDRMCFATEATQHPRMLQTAMSACQQLSKPGVVLLTVAVRVLSIESGAYPVQM